MRIHFPKTAYQWSRLFVWIFEIFLAIIGVVFAVSILDDWKGMALLVSLIFFMIAKTVVFVYETGKN